MAVPWHRIEAFSDQFARCAVTAGETAVVLAESDSRPELVEVATVALERLGAAVATVVMPTCRANRLSPEAPANTKRAARTHPASVRARLKGGRWRRSITSPVPRWR